MFGIKDPYQDVRKPLREMRKVVLPGKHNIEELLHGYCNLYLAYFLERNPDWQGVILVRKSNGFIIHAYAEKASADGTTIYADARGIFGSEKLFFKPYSFGKNSYIRREFTEEDREEALAKIQEQGLQDAIEAAYKLAYE